MGLAKTAKAFNAPAILTTVVAETVVAAIKDGYTWVAVLLEYQRDWARQGTYMNVMEIVGQHAGAYGAGTFYASTMFGGHE
ncbi:hypothetical protein SAMN04487897_108189 [Paenibacillus sp. yr247]|nr:hypothetical protein SAMN04487897_108189 [Paenibacillus sp. yr247]